MAAYLFGDPRLPSRFWSKIRIDVGGKRTLGEPCWLWTASLNGSGYGRFWPKHGTYVLAHRLVYETFIGLLPLYIPGGPEVDHECTVHACVNPHHLTLRSKQAHAEKTHPAISVIAKTGLCLRGHVFRTTPGATGCAECAIVRARAYRLRKRR